MFRSCLIFDVTALLMQVVLRVWPRGRRNHILTMNTSNSPSLVSLRSHIMSYCVFHCAPLSAFRPGGSLHRRVNCRRVPQPRWVGTRRSTKGEGNRQRGNPRPSCCPAPRSSALAVGGYKRPRGRERTALRERRPVLPRAANPLLRGPWTSLL